MSPAAQAFSVSALVAVEAEEAFAFLADGMNQRYWALGSWDRRRLGEDLFAGDSLFDGSELLIGSCPGRDLLLVDFLTGTSADALDHHVEARVIPGPTLGHPPGTCLRRPHGVPRRHGGRRAVEAPLARLRDRDPHDQGPARARVALSEFGRRVGRAPVVTEVRYRLCLASAPKEDRPSILIASRRTPSDPESPGVRSGSVRPCFRDRAFDRSATPPELLSA